MIKIVYWVFIILCLTVSVSVEATSLKLKSGRIVHGQIVDVNAQGVQVDTGFQLVSVPLRLIENTDVLPKMMLDDVSEEIKVELFVTKWCPYCKVLEALLKENGVAFSVYDIEEDQAAQARLLSLVGIYEGVPIIKIGSYIIEGYNPTRTIELLTQYKLIQKK